MSSQRERAIMSQNQPASDWNETFVGGSSQAEARLFGELARAMVGIQRRNAQRSGRNGQRTLHAKYLAGSLDAVLEIDEDAPERFLQRGFRPGARLPAKVRFSNASSLHQADAVPDMRGIAVRLEHEDGTQHDLLATNFPVSHARDARQFVRVAQIANGAKALILPRFILNFGLSETLRIVRNVRAGSRAIASLATERFWSRGAILWGEAGPVRFSFMPEADVVPAPGTADLAAEFASRLKQGSVSFRLAVQPYVDPVRTPIEDGAVEWLEAHAPFYQIGRLHVPARPGTGSEEAIRAAIDAIAFNPWTAPEAFRPLGNLNRARGPVYAASAREWGAR